MGQLRDRNAVLMPNEIEAIKVTQEVIKRMADNSAKTKTLHPPQYTYPAPITPSWALSICTRSSVGLT